MKKKKTGSGRLWIVMICVIALLGGFYFRKQITSQLGAYTSKARPVFLTASDRHPSQSASPKSQTVSSTKRKFTFFPDERGQYGWSVKYPDGRVFKLGKEFSSDCTPIVGRATTLATIRFEFNEQSSCKSDARKPIEVDAESLKDVNRHGSPELISAILTGGNIYGHTSSLISLAAKGPKVLRRLD